MNSFGSERKQTGDQELSFEEPLFVLKYRRGKVFWHIIKLVPGLLIVGLIIFAIPTKSVPELLLKSILGLLSVAAILSVAQVMSFGELRLYNDRIVEVRPWGNVEIKLANARIGWSDDPGSKMTLITNQPTKFSLRRVPLVLCGKGSISYEEDLADPEDAKRFTSMLAYLSGRNFSELEPGYIRARKLVIEGYHPKAITKDTPTEALECQIPPVGPEEKKKTARSRRILFVILGLIILIHLCVIAYSIWLRHQ